MAKKTSKARKKTASKKKTSARKTTKKKASSAKKASLTRKKTTRKTASKKASKRKKTSATTRKLSKKTGTLKLATSHLRRKPEEVLASIPQKALERMDGIARFRAAIQGMGVDSNCAKCGFTGRYVQRHAIYVEPGSHYFQDKRRRMYLHLICMQCGHVEIYCPEAIGMNV